MDLLGDLHGDHGDTAEKVTADADAENKCRGSDIEDEEEGMDCESLLYSEEPLLAPPIAAAATATAAIDAGNFSAGSSAKPDLANATIPAHIVCTTGQPSEGPAATAQPSESGSGQTYKGPPYAPSVGEKAKAYIQKKKAEKIAEIKNSFKDKLLAYEAVNAANRRRLSTPYLQSGGAAGDDIPPEEDDFTSLGDGRAASMFISCNLQLKHNISYSFNPTRKVCTFCPAARDHSVLGAPRGSSSNPPGREAIVLSDQAYPPILPSNSERACIRIIRVEYGTIHDLVTTLLDLTRDRVLANGSIIMIFSASHLANVGLTAYVEDLVAANRRISGVLGRSIYFTGAPPLLLGGTYNSDLIISISALTAWIGTAVGEESTLSSASKVAFETILENGGGGGQYNSCSRVRLPCAISSHDNKKIWAVGGDSDLPYTTDPVSIEQETKIIYAMILDLQQNLALELDSYPVIKRDLGSRGEAGAASYLVVGSSNAKRLEEALKAKGLSTGAVFANNWRATKKSAEDMAAHVKAALEEGSYSAVVFHLLDNNIFFSRFEDGSLCPARKATDGQYHVDGELVIASRESQYAILKLCTPLWEAAKDHKMVVVGPMPRYVSAGCCPDTDHVTNRNSLGFYQKMKDDLAACGGAIKDFLFTAGLRNGRLMDPARQLRSRAAAEIWGADPIHPKKEIYGLLADGVIEVARSCNGGQQKKSASSVGDGGTYSAAAKPPYWANSHQNFHSGGGKTRGGPAASGGRHSWKRGGGSNWRSHHRRAGGGRGRWSGPY